MGGLGNKEIMASNILRLMEENGKTRAQICNDLGFKYSTFSEWVQGVKYPRIDKIEQMAIYFGVLKSDLIEEHHSSTAGDEDMATDKPRLSITMEEDMLGEVEQFQQRHNITTKSKAIIRLTKIGLETVNKTNDIINIYDSLDAHGQHMVEVVAAEEQARLDSAKRPAPKKPTPPPVEVAGPAVEPDYRQMPFAAHGPVPEAYTEEEGASVEGFQREVARRKHAKKND